jgi:hypothetical protein
MSLFANILGTSFNRLPKSIQRVHDHDSCIVLKGQCTIERGKGIAVAIIARAAALPPSGVNVPLTVTITRDQRQREIWERNFSGHIMRSRLWQQSDLLAERLGLMTLLFALSEQGGAIIWTVRGARLLGIPLPTAWFAQSTASESEVNGRYCFDVQASLPMIGRLIHYRGWLEVVDGNQR